MDSLAVFLATQELRIERQLLASVPVAVSDTVPVPEPRKLRRYCPCGRGIYKHYAWCNECRTRQARQRSKTRRANLRAGVM